MIDVAKKKRAIIYCRVSDKKQKHDGDGLHSQEHRCREYASARGYEVDAVFRDDVSGGGDFMKRPGMVALLSYLDAQRARKDYVVIFDDLKRFARDTEFHIQLRRAFQKRRARVAELLEAVGMAEQAGKRPDQLSGGQKQRVAVARALATRARIVLADEPTANLDHATAYRIIGLMKKMRDEAGTTFVFSTHDPKIVGEAETVITLEDGRIVNGGGRA